VTSDEIRGDDEWGSENANVDKSVKTPEVNVTAEVIRTEQSYDCNSRNCNTLSTKTPSVKLLNCSLGIFL
jgi:hypothetical protein